MASADKSAPRAVLVVVLMIVAALALRGYLPGVERVVEDERRSTNPVALIIDVLLLCAAVAIMVVAIVVRLRDRSARPAPSRRLPTSPGTSVRLRWRYLLVALFALISWLVVVMLLMHPREVSGGAPPESGSTATSEPTTAPRDANDRPREQPSDPGDGVLEYLVVPMLVLMALTVVGTVIVARRRPPLPERPPVFDDFAAEESVEAAEQSLVRAAEVGLAEIADHTREPREAIIACYAAMERELTRVPRAAPQDFDTPTEVLARAVAHDALRADSATRLVELFEEARFSPHLMTEEHRDDAVWVLQRVLEELAGVT